MKLSVRSRMRPIECWMVIAAVGVAAGCDQHSVQKEKVMKERTGLVTLKGNKVTLIGSEVKVGQRAPDVILVANDLSTVSLSSLLKDKIGIIASVPSLDTSVCDTETRRFNQEAAGLSKDVAVLTVSMDLPFAQARWCGAAGIKNLQTLSDHRDAAFGTSYGVLIKEVRLLARAIFVVDKAGVIRYIQIVKEVATEPDYQAALAAVKGLQ
jgi:thioredoxin-dependent peroxiredoxin